MLCSSKTALTHNFLDGSDDALWAGYVELFKWRAEGNWRVGSRDQLNGCIKLGEGFVCDQCSYICGSTTTRVIFIYHDKPVRFRY